MHRLSCALLMFNCMTMTVELPLDYTVFLLAAIAQARWVHLVSHLTFAWNTVTLLYAGSRFLACTSESWFTLWPE